MHAQKKSPTWQAICSRFQNGGASECGIIFSFFWETYIYIYQAQNKGMSYPLLGKLFAAAAKLLAQVNLTLKGDGLKNDFNDIARTCAIYVFGYVVMYI